MDSCRPPPPESRDEPGLSLGLVASFTSWYTGHKGAQKGEKGCQKAELSYLHGLAGGLLRKDGSWLSFSHPSSMNGRETRRGVRKRKGLGSVLYSAYSPNYPLSYFSLLEKKAQYQSFLNLTLPVGVMEICFVVVQLEYSPIWSLREDPST